MSSSKIPPLTYKVVAECSVSKARAGLMTLRYIFKRSLLSIFTK